MAKKEETADPVEQYRRLVHWLRDQYGGKRGWQAQAARRLDVHQVTLSRFMTGERSVGLDVIERAVYALPIDREYFFGTRPGDDPGQWMVPQHRPNAPSADDDQERWFWRSVSMVQPFDFKAGEDADHLDDRTCEMLAEDKRNVLKYFAEGFPEVAEARRLSNATPREIVKGWNGWVNRVRRLESAAAGLSPQPETVSGKRPGKKRS